MSIDWRTIGDVSLDTWKTELKSVGSPLFTISESCYRAVQPHSALALAMLKQESGYATRFRLNTPDNHNPLNLRPPDGDGYLHFASWADGLRAWRDRLTDPNYKAGVYARTATISDLIHVYAPASDSNNEIAYVAGISIDLVRWGITPKEQSVSITTGRVPYPDVIQSHLPASNPYVVESGAPKIPEAIIWHRMLGSWGGTNNWFHGGNAATCYGVAVAATDGAATAGKIYEWIAPRNGWYGESSGPAEGPYGDGLIYANEVGVASINRCSKAIEISGEYDTQLDDKARYAIAAMTAYWADQRGIPWTEFPHYKAKGRSFVIWHNEITGLAYKQCPGSVVMAETDVLIELTRQIMKRYQEDAVTVPEPIKPAPINWKPGDVGVSDYHGQKVYRLLAQVTCKRETLPRVAASTKKGKNSYGPNIEPEQTITIVGTLDAPWYFWDKGDGTYPRVSRSAFYPSLPRPRDAS